MQIRTILASLTDAHDRTGFMTRAVQADASTTKALSRTEMGMSLFMLRALRPAFRPALRCADTRLARAKCAGYGSKPTPLFRISSTRCRLVLMNPFAIALPGCGESDPALARTPRIARLQLLRVNMCSCARAARSPFASALEHVSPR